MNIFQIGENMGIDGMSMGQIKPIKELPSNHLSIEAEILASKKVADMEIDLDLSKEKLQVDRKEENYGEDVGNPIPGGDTYSDDEDEVQMDDSDEDKEGDFSEERKYIIRYNEELNIIELYDNEINEVIDIITEENFREIAKKIKYASGLIVTKKI